MIIAFLVYILCGAGFAYFINKRMSPEVWWEAHKQLTIPVSFRVSKAVGLVFFALVWPVIVVDEVKSLAWKINTSALDAAGWVPRKKR